MAHKENSRCLRFVIGSIIHIDNPSSFVYYWSFFHTVSKEYVLNVTKFILNLPFGLAGLLIGGVHQLIVVTGVHHIFNLLESQLITADKKDHLMQSLQQL